MVIKAAWASLLLFAAFASVVSSAGQTFVTCDALEEIGVSCATLGLETFEKVTSSLGSGDLVPIRRDDDEGKSDNS